jgi:penicillin-binding protein 1C
LEKRQSKEDILVEYANRAPFGGNLTGVGSASWRYFGRPCAQLSLAEAALLAGLPQSPNRLRPDRFPQAALARRNHVLDRMRELGMIDARQHDDACAEATVASWRPLPQDRAAIADGAMPTLASLAASHPGVTLRTTLDSAVQHQVWNMTADHLAKLESSNITAAAVVVLDTETSECLAAVSLSRANDHVDLTRSCRSTGSTLKPFIYAAAFANGICTPDTVLEDSPVSWAGYEPADYDRKFRGNITAGDALAESRNIPAMLVLAQVGVEPAVGVMEAAGLKTLAKTPGRYGLSLAIGGAEASPKELAQAYAMLARAGVGKDVSLIRAPGQSDTPSPSTPGEGRGGGHSAGSLVLEKAPSLTPLTLPREYTGEGTRKSAPIIPADACWQTLTAISGSDRTAAICPTAVKTHVAWKTGTSNGHRDAWCAAVTRHRTVIVWLGNAAGQASPALVGAEAAAPLALRLMASLDAAPNEPWPLVKSQVMATPTRAAKPGPTSLSLISPTPGEQFLLDPDSPADRQRVLLKASLHTTGIGSASESRTLWWFVDGQPAGLADAGSQLWWPPTPGNHEIRVIDAHGHGATAVIGVR